jgi:pentatricopeptide repeat protein
MKNQTPNDNHQSPAAVQTTTAPQSASLPASSQPWKECLAIMDDNTWIWHLAEKSFLAHEKKFMRVPSTVTVRHSWSRFKDAPCMVLHWESKSRPGGAIVEEILDVESRFDVSNKIIVVTTNPIHEDVVYFSELGIRRIVRIRNRDKELATCEAELKQHVLEATATQTKATMDSLWRRILVAIDRLPEKPEGDILNRIEENILKLKGVGKTSAREFDAMASIAFYRGETATAFKYWESAIQNNPNYFRTYNNMIQAHRKLGQHHDAYNLLLKMQMLNRSSIARLVALGETQLALNDERKAEHYFQSALEKDSWCSGALNGMAEIKFKQGELDTARELLEKSNVAYRYATKLNLLGIDMVKQGRYGDALEHYSKAQYVLPQQEKGPQLFFNIGLCYSKWDKPQMAKEFLKLALIKEPNYKKAQKLLDLLEGKNQKQEEDMAQAGTLQKIA